MYLIRDNRTGKEYKTRLDINQDKLRHLFTYAFVKAKAITEEEASSDIMCTEKWSFIKQRGKIDGRSVYAKTLPYFTWRIVFETD